jgi:O-acetylhomoserine/O-acetylserine sulfhydrylase-like pyridoxal-dependent enzyme
VFRSSTYVFASPEAAEHAFAITTGKIKPVESERADLIYSRFSHPNAELLEDEIVPLEAGTREAAVFNSGIGSHSFLEPFGVRGIPVPAGNADAMDEALRSAKTCCFVFETPANPTLIMSDIERVAEATAKHQRSFAVATLAVGLAGELALIQPGEVAAQLATNGAKGSVSCGSQSALSGQTYPGVNLRRPRLQSRGSRSTQSACRQAPARPRDHSLLWMLSVEQLPQRETRRHD